MALALTQQVLKLTPKPDILQKYDVKRMRKLFEVLLVLIILFSGCSNEQPEYPYKQLSLETFGDLRNHDYAISNKRIQLFIDSFRLAERDTNYVDILVNKYYADRQPYLWIDRMGADLRPDTLLHWLNGVERDGLPEHRFYLDKIRFNLSRLRQMQFDNEQTVSRTLATLEYYLTKTYLRYCAGQRFGFINPKKYYNHLQLVPDDTTGTRYLTLFSATLDEFGKKFFDTALRCLKSNNLNLMLTEVQPTSELYNRLTQELRLAHLTAEQRRCLLVNLERARWRLHRKEGHKYVEVNLPAQQLDAFDEDGQHLSMRICLGSAEHKTPLLNSAVTHLEFNPYWIIPKSIIRRDILHHLGDTAYFSNRRFKIVDRQTGDYVSPLNATSEMLLGPHYLVRQDKGEDNSLGRMIFRFPNHHSIYLHDTNNREAFGRTHRAVSHGCIRLEKPFELATFLLNDKDEDYIDLMRLSLDLPPQTEHGRELKESGRYTPLKRCDYKPPIPLYIIYYTAYPTPEGGRIAYYPDLYHYDGGIYRLLSN